VGYLPWVGVHYQGIYEKCDWDQEWMAFGSGSSLLQGKGIGRLRFQKDAEEQGKVQTRARSELRGKA